MGADVGTIDVYLESGSKRVLAVAVDWPGWCRGGKDEGSALAALLQAAPRYAAVVKAAGLTFAAPTGIAEFQVCDRLTGSTATDMGVPERLLPADAEPLSEDETARSVRLLRACWGAFDRAVAAARGSALRKGPRRRWAGTRRDRAPRRRGRSGLCRADRHQGRVEGIDEHGGSRCGSGSKP